MQGGTEPGSVDNDAGAQSYVYGLGGGTSPSPRRRPTPRPACVMEYIVRVLSVWPPTVEEGQGQDQDQEEEEEEAPLQGRSGQPAGQ